MVELANRANVRQEEQRVALGKKKNYRGAQPVKPGVQLVQATS